MLGMIFHDVIDEAVALCWKGSAAIIALNGRHYEQVLINERDVVDTIYQLSAGVCDK